MTLALRLSARRRRLLISAGIFLLVLIAYAPAFRAGFIWDDNAYVTDNDALRTLHGLQALWLQPSATPQYYPLVFTTFWIQWHLWGNTAWPYHALNILLHAAECVVLWRLLLRLRIRAALFVSLLFAVHPVCVESVAWVTERKNVLSGLLYLLAFTAYLPVWKYPNRPLDRRAYARALGLFVLALLSKTVTSTLPAAVLLVIYWKRGRIVLRDVLLLLPFFALGILAGAHTGYLERTHVGAKGLEWNLAPLDRLLIAGRAVWFYVAKLFLPTRLTFMYPRWSIDTHLWWQWIYPLAAIASVVLLWLFRKRIGRGPLVAWLFFIGTLTPALGFFNVYPMRYSFVADHFQYLACIGVLCLFASALWRLNWARPLAWPLIAVLTALTFWQTLIYRDSETLWRDTLAKNPDSWMAHTNLGHALVAQQRQPEAWLEYQKALQLAPGLPETHLNVGMGHAILGDFDAAIAESKLAIQRDPQYFPAYVHLSRLLRQKGQLIDAVQAAKMAIALVPNNPDGHLALGNAMEQLKVYSRAAAEFQLAVDLDPDNALAHSRLADCLNYLGQLEPAAAEYRAGLNLDSNNAPAWVSLGTILLRTGNRPDAAVCFQRALSIDPSLEIAKKGLAAASR